MQLTAADKIRYGLDWVRERIKTVVPVVLARWEIIETNRIPTACTDGKVLLYNPDYINNLSMGATAALVLHEAGHPLFGHTTRLALEAAERGIKPGSAGYRRMAQEHNVAADLAINSLFKSLYEEAGGHDLIPNGCFPGQGEFAGYPKGKSMDYYLRLIREDFPPPKKHEPPAEGKPEPSGDSSGSAEEIDPAEQDHQEQGDAAEGGEDSESEEGDGDTNDNGDAAVDGEGDTEGDSSDPLKESPDPDGSEDDSQEGSKPGDGSTPSKDGSDSAIGDDGGEPGGKGGSGKRSLEEIAGETDEDNGLDPLEAIVRRDGFGSYEESEIDHEGTPEEVKASAEEAKRKWQESVATACVMDKSLGLGQGDYITGQLRAAALMDTPDNAGWVLLIKRFLTQMAPGGYTFARPSRRHLWRTDIIMPSARSRCGGRGMAIVDTSGSMGDKHCDRGLVEIERSLRMFPAMSVKLVSCDTAVIEGKEYKAQDFPIREHEGWKGRGGTELSPAFEFAKKYRPDWLIVISDMRWTYTATPDPGCPTLWIGVGPAVREYYGQVPFGTFLAMPAVL